MTYSSSHFPIAGLGPRGAPTWTIPARRVLNPIGWEGTCLIAHLMTEFFDPWEHFYDSYPQQYWLAFHPVDYRVDELSRALGEDVGWIVAWLDRRLISLQPPLALLTDYAFKVLDDEDVSPMAEAIRTGDDDRVLALALAGLADPMVAPAVDWMPAISADGGTWNPELRDHPKFAQIVGRCVANRDWTTLDGWFDTGPRQPTPALIEELRCQMKGSERWPFTTMALNHNHATTWLDALIRARLDAAGWPRCVRLGRGQRLRS